MKLYLREPLILTFLDGRRLRPEYREKVSLSDREECYAVIRAAGYEVKVTDITRSLGGNRISFYRRVEGHCTVKEKAAGGLSVGAEWSLQKAGPGPWRFGIPSIHYTREEKTDKNRKVTFMEDRLSANLAAAVNIPEQTAYIITKTSVSKNTQRPDRRKGESRYLHRTQNTSLGYRMNAEGEVAFCIRWPYEEAEKSVFLDASQTPAEAYYPLDGQDFREEFEYILEERKAENFTDSLYGAFVRLAEELEEKGEKVKRLHFSPDQSMEYRMDSLGRSYREFEEDGAGFFFHFDPRKGYGSLPSGFGTSFGTIPHDSYPHILEYGFTGRQINAALVMAQKRGKEWILRGERVIEFFLKNCTTDSGWLYSLYDLNTKAPFYSFGDEDAPKLHYISRTTDKGNYLRTMTEPMNDVLEAYRWYKDQGMARENWIREVIKFADFLVRMQKPDGSWSRAYKPDGLPASIGADQGSIESATSIPLVFLCNLCRELRENNASDESCQRAAVRAGDYVIKNYTACEYYEGGTLDNPNIVDKEAAQYAMAGLYHLYGLTGDRKYLDAALEAAKQFVTWNYIWNAPVEKDTFLGAKGFRTKGFGAINSIWGGGVVDIYSLFHIRELYLIGKETGEPFLCKMAEWISVGTAQILSCPGDSMGFADIGMQPEGFGVCCQGADEGMIQKGDVWGTLGWIYSAGIYGLGRYLEAVRALT